MTQSSPTRYAQSGEISIAYQVMGAPLETRWYLEVHIPGAKYAELQGNPHFYFVDDADALVVAKAEANEVWASRTVKNLVAGSGLEFSEREIFDPKGIPGTWPLFAVN